MFDPSLFVQYANLAKLSCVSSSRRTNPVPFASRASDTMLANRPYCPLAEPLWPTYRVTLTPFNGVLSAATSVLCDISCTNSVSDDGDGSVAGSKLSCDLPMASAASDA